MLTLYIIRSTQGSQRYIGITGELTDRMYQHNAGTFPDTPQGHPWELLWDAKFDTLAKAQATKKKIEEAGIEAFLKDQGYH